MKKPESPSGKFANFILTDSMDDPKFGREGLPALPLQIFIDALHVFRVKHMYPPPAGSRPTATPV